MFKSKTFLTLLFALGLCFPLMAQMSGTYTVDPGGKGDFLSLSEAATALSTNGVNGPVLVRVLNGTYREQLTIEKINGLSATNTLTFKGEDKQRTVIEFSTTVTDSRHVVMINELSYVTIRDFTINNTSTSLGWGVHVFNNSTSSAAPVVSSNVINCDVSVYKTSSTNFNGILYNRSTTSYTSTGSGFVNCLVDSSTVVGGYIGIFFGSNRNASSATGNAIKNSTVIDFYYYGLYLNSLYGFEVDGNYLEPSSTASTANLGIQYFNNTSGGTHVIKINNNHIMNVGRYGIYFSSAQGGNSTTNPSQRGQIFNNFIKVVGNSTPRGIFGNGTYSGYFDIYHNSVVLATATSSTASGCIYFDGDYCAIKNNNLAYMPSSGIGTALYINSAGRDLVVDYNNYYSNASGLVVIAAAYDASNFVGGGGYNANSYNLDPNFISINDLHLDSTKSFPSGEANLGVSLDIDGDSRCSFAPSIGADQSRFKPSVKPRFIQIDTGFVSSPVVFLNQGSTDDPVKFAWSVNGKEISNSFHFTYSFANTGSYTVSLKASNCFNESSDTTYTIHIVSPTKAPIANFTTDKTIIERGELLSLTDLSVNGPSDWLWKVSPDSAYNPLLQYNELTYDFEVGSSETSQNPVMYFLYPGIYDIKLIARNSVGVDSNTKSMIVEVVSSYKMCDFPDVTTNPKGFLYDDGGATGNYNTNRNCDFVIAPCGGHVVLNLMEFNLGANDYLKIYEGDNNQGNPLWDVTNFPLGLTGSMAGSMDFTAVSGKMYIQFQSDAGTTTLGPGFKAYWTVDPVTLTPPVVDFIAPDTICTGIDAFFINQTTGNFLTYEWRIDQLPSGKDLDFKNNFGFSGSYEVTLVAENCGGKDSLTKTVVVSNLNQAPTPSFTANLVKPNLNEVVTLYNTTGYCYEDLTWTIEPSTFEYINGTNNKSAFPQVIFKSTGCYDVSLAVSNSVGGNTVKRTCYINAGRYCTPVTQKLSRDLGITSFTLGSLSNQSQADVAGYTSYGSVPKLTVYKGASYNFELASGGSTFAFSAAIWIDLNGNNVFESSEKVASTASNSGQFWTGTIKIPVSAATTQTRLRVQMSSANALHRPCGPNIIGEYEDYMLEIVPDTEIPIITLLGNQNMTIEAGRTYLEPGYNAFDTQSGNITDDVVVVSNLNTQVTGNYAITYDVQDEAGNDAQTVTRSIRVSPDVSKPHINIIGLVIDTIEVGTTYTDLGATAIDSLDGDITANLVTVNNLDVNRIGTYTITYTATDAANNDSTGTRIVVVVDLIAPNVLLLGGDTLVHEVLTTYMDSGVVATDNHDTLSEMTTVINTNLNETILGLYSYQICVSDQSGNQTCVTRYISVEDNEAPSLSLRGADTLYHEVNTDFSDPWVMYSDNFSRNVTLNVTGTFTATNVLGEFTIIYTASDENGNQSTLTRYVNVVDRTAPEIALAGDEVMFVQRWSEFIDPGVVVSDNYDAEADITVTIGGDFTNTQSNGRYFITYKATDTEGNESKVLTRVVDVDRTISISEVEAAEFTMFPNPARDNFSLKIKYDNAEIKLVEIKDLTGRVLYSQVQNTKELQTQMNISGWKSGAYLIVIQTNKGVQSKPFMVY